MEAEPMTSQTPDMQAVLERLNRLERHNRRLKQAALAAFVLATALATIYATQPVPQKITAHEFDVVDNSGRVRVGMGMLSGVPVITLSDMQGKGRAEMTLIPSGVPIIALSDAQGKTRAQMNLGFSGEPFIALSDAQGDIRVGMSVSSSGEPKIVLGDAQGFEMKLGSTQTVTPPTGETQQSSAASIVMFGNDEKHHVIWRAP
jgi:hypothetical protein